ncbi:ABC transporter ATP-binding protein [Clostridium butyricum]|uniref:ABC transporter ATP-binding protein n=1 Tax=Clostridium butyricum TaxID=1492 RepID=UPI0018AA076D|nr:ABC transporter ATP-binding protein [Clostridium butyricum]
MIRVENVCMDYKMTYDKVNSIKEYFTKLIKGQLKYKEFHALSNVTFNVEKGEVVGILGHNGAGKSTILKVISGILKPTHGKVVVNGNIVPMLELGSGFDYDLTGKENIFLNGAILGYSKEFLSNKYNEIVEFSELDNFIDMPIRNYSSGMLMRLAFSIATVINPEILIVDEILAVGDANFQEKSKARMLELMAGGTTVLFVSHSLDQIRELCNRVVWLDHGKVKMIDETQKVCDEYIKS